MSDSFTFDGDALVDRAVDEVPEDPVIEDRNPEVSLLFGFSDHPKYGTAKTATVRELTGYDEEHLAQVRKGSRWRFLLALLERGVDRVGHTPADYEMLRELPRPDINTLLLAVRVASYGPSITYRETCGNQECRADNEVTFTLPDDVPVLDPKPRPWTVSLRDGTVLGLDPLNGEAQERLTKAFDDGLTEAELNTVLIQEAVTGVVQGERLWTGDDAARSLSVRDRATVIEAIAEHDSGPNLTAVPYSCSTCGEVNLVAIGVVEMFR